MVAIDGLNDRESFISDPWSQLYQLMQSVAQHLEWKIGKLLLSDGSDFWTCCLQIVKYWVFVYFVGCKLVINEVDSVSN